VADKIERSGDVVLSLQDRGAFKLKEACAYLGGLSPITVRRLMKRGLIRRIPAVRHVLVAKAELDRFLAGPWQNMGRESGQKRQT